MSQEIIKYVDIDSALARMRGNRKLYAKMLNMFLVSKEFESFDAAIAESDLEKAADLAHTIKGMTGNLSLPALFEQSAQLMQELRQGEMNAALIEAYRESYALTKQFVKQTIEEFSAG